MTAHPSPGGEPVGDDVLASLLRTIGAGAGGEPLDSAAVGRRLGWSAASTAAALDAAKGRLLVWGIRIGGSPGPCFDDLELTVQGRRFLTAFDA